LRGRWRLFANRAAPAALNGHAKALRSVIDTRTEGRSQARSSKRENLAGLQSLVQERLREARGHVRRAVPLVIVMSDPRS